MQRKVPVNLPSTLPRVAAVRVAAVKICACLHSLSPNSWAVVAFLVILTYIIIKIKYMTWIIVLVVVVLLALWLVGQYNNLVRMRNNRENAFANIDVQLRQRYDLIPQLVATVKGYATHEKELLQRVTEARTAAMGATNINDKIAADNQLTGALAGLKVQLEAYPDLKANQNFMQLQTEIADIENKLAATRRFFNSATRELNNAVQVFPSNIIAQMFGFHKEVMFEIPQTDREAMDKAPEIKF